MSEAESARHIARALTVAQDHLQRGNTEEARLSIVAAEHAARELANELGAVQLAVCDEVQA